jgi:hypothetical protein
MLDLHGGSAMIPAKKKADIRDYMSPQPRDSVVKHPKAVSARVGIKRALDHLPAAKKTIKKAS